VIAANSAYRVVNGSFRRHNQRVVSAAAIATSVGPLVGRRRELAALQALVEVERLVTITGAGGSGKTRVALELMASAERDTAFVPLAAVREPAHVAAAIAQELGLGRGDEQELVAALAQRRLLLCLDNFEHVVEAAPLVTRLLAAAPDLRVLVTSRTPLRVSGEQEFPLEPLAREDAVAFFAARARRFRPDFEPDEAVAEICRRLDDLPLALELAAVRVKLLAPAQILERLERRLPLLTGGARDLPERHRTLRATIDWSYQLLSVEEARLFQRLALFPGGCTLEAVEAVAGSVPDPFERLASLVDKSLLRRQDDAASPRFRMLETLREYALERLEDSGETAAAHAAQCAHYVALAKCDRLEGTGPRYAEWEDLSRAELDNVESVVLWALDHDGPAAVEIVANWGLRLHRLGPARVGTWIERVLTVAETAPPAEAARVYGTLAAVNTRRRDHAGAAALYERALALAAQHSPERVPSLRARLAAAWAYMGRDEEGAAALELALAEARATNDDATLRGVLISVGYATVALHDLERGRAVLEEALVLCERTGAMRALATTHNNLGTVLLETEPERAAAHFRAGLAVPGLGPDQLRLREGLGVCALMLGDPESARRQLLDVARETRRIGRLGTLHASVTSLAAVAAATGRHETAARIAGATRAFRPSVAVEPYLRAFFADARRALGEERWGRLHADGEQLSIDDAIELAAAGEAAEEVRRAFVFTDIVSSTQLLELIGDDAWGDLVSWHDRTLRALFAAHAGEEVDHAGDGFFVAFPGAREAVACAGAIQLSLAAHRQANGFAPQVRIGVHSADATRSDGGYRGLGVHTAARIAALAGGGEVVASLATADAAGASTAGPAEHVELKGLAEPVPVVRVAWRDAA
jgi:predicted ATPase/class 3 adenylate cyclase